MTNGGPATGANVAFTLLGQPIGKGAVSAPVGANGLEAGTDFHVVWNAAGMITSAWWTRVGTVLAQIPVVAGQTAIAMTQG